MKMLNKKALVILGLLAVAPFTASAAVIDLTAKTTTISNPVELNLTAGTYNINPFAGTFTSWNAWGSTTGCDGAGGNCTKGWLNNYSFSSTELGTIFMSDTVKYSTPELALLNALSTTFTLLSDATVKFFINDSNYRDNIGGMSLNVTQVSAVPLPAAAFLFAPALIGFMGLRRKAKSTVA